MTASIVTYPHEVLRTRLQTYRRLKGPIEVPDHHGGRVPGVVRMAKFIVHHEGWSALYRGLSVNLVRTVPNSAVTMLTYVTPPFSVNAFTNEADKLEQIRDVDAIPHRTDSAPTMTSAHLLPRLRTN